MSRTNRVVGAVGTRGYGQGDPRKQDLRWPGVRVMQGGTSFPAQAGVLCTLVEIKFNMSDGYFVFG